MPSSTSTQSGGYPWSDRYTSAEPSPNQYEGLSPDSGSRLAAQRALSGTKRDRPAGIQGPSSSADGSQSYNSMPVPSVPSPSSYAATAAWHENQTGYQFPSKAPEAGGSSLTRSASEQPPALPPKPSIYHSNTYSGAYSSGGGGQTQNYQSQSQSHKHSPVPSLSVTPSPDDSSFASSSNLGHRFAQMSVSTNNPVPARPSGSSATTVPRDSWNYVDPQDHPPKTSGSVEGDRGEYDFADDDFSMMSDDNIVDDFFNASLLSHVAVKLRDKVPRETHVKGSLPFENAFTGKDMVVRTSNSHRSPTSAH